MTYNIKELENKNRIFNEKLIEEENKISKLKEAIGKHFYIDSQTIQAKTRKLKARWSVESEKDLKSYGRDITSDITDSVKSAFFSWAGTVFKAYDENSPLILPVKDTNAV
jgi:hypothetical protein